MFTEHPPVNTIIVERTNQKAIELQHFFIAVSSEGNRCRDVDCCAIGKRTDRRDP